MISAKTALSHYRIHPLSPSAAIQDVRLAIEESTNPLDKAHQIILAITGLTPCYKSLLKATHVAQCVAETAVNNDLFDADDALTKAEQHSDRIHVTQPWITAVAAKDISTTETVAFVEGLDVKVAINKAGGIKKGGKKILTEELYKKHVLNAATPLNNIEFVKLLVTQLGITLSCSRTYAHNVSRKFKSNT